MIDFSISRKNMINNQLKVNNIKENNILEAIDSIPREIFLPFHLKSRAYLDEDTEIASNRYLIEPLIAGYILQLSQIKITDVVLDLVCASGYTTAILSKLAKEVYGVDNNKLLLKESVKNHNSLNIQNSKFILSYPKNGLKTKMKFDVIVIFGGVEFISDRRKKDCEMNILVLRGNTYYPSGGMRCVLEESDSYEDENLKLKPFFDWFLELQLELEQHIKG